MKASIVIAVWNKLEYTRRCLDAIARTTPADLYELIVVDNASTDGTADYLASVSHPAPLRVIRNDENLGFVGANNIGIAAAQGEHVVFLNNDTEPQEGWLEALLDTLEDPTVGAVGAMLVYPSGRLQEAGAIIFSDGSGWNYGRGEAPGNHRYLFARDVDYCSAACLAVRGTLVRSLGGFDERYAPAYYEDTDLCFATRAAGLRVVYQPGAHVVHHEGATAGTDVGAGMKRHQVVNREKFVEKWADALALQQPPRADLVRRASDRRPGKRILVVDPFVPAYDRASGSRRLFEILRLLAEDGNIVTFLARNPIGAEPYATELRAHGIEVIVGDVEKLRDLGFDASGVNVNLPELLRETGYSLVWLSFHELARQYLPDVRTHAPGAAVVVDSVDLHWVREAREAELKGRTLDPAAKEAELEVYAAADAVVVVTAEERETLLAELPGAEVLVVPNVHADDPTTTPYEERSGLLFVGNFRHPPNADGIAWFLRDVLPLVREELPQLGVTVVGDAPPEEVRAVSTDGVDLVGWVQDLHPELERHRVSIAPLRYGGGLKGKVGEALANGLPVVTTSMGAEGVDPGALRIADDPQGFARAVVEVYRDGAVWAGLRAAGLEHVRARYAPAAVRGLLRAVRQVERSAERPVASLAILVHDQLELTRSCLESVERHTPEPHEVLLVDNASGPETAAFLEEYAAARTHVRLVRNDTNLGFAAGNNQALSIAHGDAVVLLNNDTVVSPGWLSRMLAVLDREPRVGLVGPLSNRVSGAQLVDDYDGDPVAYAGRIEGAAAQPVTRVVGFCLVVRREVVDAIGGLDEAFGPGNFEDDDFCLRAAQAGWEARVARDAFVEHVGSQTFAAAGIDYVAAMQANWQIFARKWSLEQGATTYAPAVLVAGAPQPRLPLPALGETHVCDVRGNVWHRREPTLAERVRTSFEDGGLAGLFDGAAYQDACQIVERVFVLADGTAPRTWLRAYSSAARGLLDWLADAPCEPVLLNYAGILLFEIGDVRGAEALFRAAGRLDPELRGLRGNLRAVRSRKRGGARTSFPPPRDLTRLALAVAARVRPEQGLTLSLCMIVKDEEEMLPGCLEAVHGVVDEIVIVDTGSSDRTVEIAESFGARVLSFPWNGSFSDARNVGLDAATGDWILQLDADEQLVPEDGPLLRDLLRRTWREAFHLVETNYTGGDESGSSVEHLALRVWRNRPEYRFAGRIHEQITPSMPTQLGQRFEVTPIRIRHFGYLKERVTARDKSSRNLELLELEAREAPTPFTSFNLGSEYLGLAEPERARPHLERAWEELRAEPDWHVVGYAPLLARRLLRARRECGDLIATRAGVETALHMWPDHTDVVFELALAERAAGNVAAAVELAERCLELGDAPARYGATIGSGSFLALGLLAELRPESAEELLRRSLAEHPDFVAPVLPLTAAMLARGASAAEVLEVVPDRTSALTLAATGLYEAGRPAEAEPVFRRVLGRQPSNAVARVGLVECLLSQGRWEGAVHEAGADRDGLSVAPLLAEAELFALAVSGRPMADALARSAGDGLAPEVAAVFAAWAGLGPLPGAASAGAIVRMLEALLRVQEFQAFERVVPLLEGCLPERERREALARLYLRRGFLQSAADEWLAVVADRPDVDAFVGLAQVAAATGDVADAAEIARQAVRLDPESPAARALWTALEAA